MIFRDDKIVIANDGPLDGLHGTVLSTLEDEHGRLVSIRLDEGRGVWQAGNEIDLSAYEIRKVPTVKPDAPFIIDQGQPGWLPLKLRGDV